MPRLFLALELPADIRLELSRLQQELIKSFRHSKIRWTPPENLHITLHFLGDVALEQMQRLQDDLRRLKYPDPFSLALEHIGAFPSPKKPRIIMAETSVHPFLFLLRRRIADAIVGNGIDIEGKQFRPHVTLGRVSAQSETFPEKISELQPLRFKVEEFVLMESTLTPDGSEYRVIERFRLH